MFDSTRIHKRPVRQNQRHCPLSQLKGRDSTHDSNEFQADSTDGAWRDTFRREPDEENNPYENFYPQQVIDDLAAFGLKAPSSLEEIRKARNREYNVGLGSDHANILKSLNKSFQ